MISLANGCYCLAVTSHNWHYVNNALNWIRGIAGIVRNTFAGGFERFGFAGW